MSPETENLLQQARQARRENRLADAQRDLLLAVDLLRQEGDRAELAQVLRDLGELERRLPDAEAARQHYEESVALFREVGEPLRLAHTVRHLGDVHYEAGRAELAEACYHEALALYRCHEHAPPLDLANAIRSLALLKDHAGAAEEARALWQEAHDIYAAFDVQAGVAECAARLARLARRQRDQRQKRDNFRMKMFSSSTDRIWRRLCAEIDASYIEGLSWWKGDKVEAVHGEWTVTLDTLAASSALFYTRLRAPYVNPDHFQFTIYRRGWFSDIAKWFGMQDVEVGHAEFDLDFVIKGNDEEKLRALFDNARLRELITAQPQVYFTVQDDEGMFGVNFPADTDELCFYVYGIVGDIKRLKLLFELFSETLDQLCRIGSADKGAPRVKL